MNIQEIARLADVSVSTVSKVMNGKDKDISKKTKDKVLKIIEENNYIPYARYRVKEG
ncbi:MAG: LacI family DNA-binding transcriptional regulator, partial [Lachnospiraceae bacterium]|nr:LacI family DNA-binding transcriptional regulator [Lachnospiraceae bacterium]